MKCGAEEYQNIYNEKTISKKKYKREREKKVSFYTQNFKHFSEKKK